MSPTAHDRRRPAGTPRALRELIVRVTDLGTDARSETAAKVVVPPDEPRRRLQLIDAVKADYPDARLKSYADDVASFLCGPVMIVAHYGRTLRVDQVEPTDVQEPLFDAAA